MMILVSTCQPSNNHCPVIVWTDSSPGKTQSGAGKKKMGGWKLMPAGFMCQALMHWSLILFHGFYTERVKKQLFLSIIFSTQTSDDISWFSIELC